MKFESEAKPASSPIWIGYRSYSGSVPDGKTFYVVIPKSTLGGKPGKVKVTVEWEVESEP